MKNISSVAWIILSTILMQSTALAACGDVGKTPCKVWERIPSCDKGLVEDFKANKCVRPASAKRPDCGAANHRPCLITERIPSCNKGLVEDFGAHKCVAKASLSCGAKNQRPCLVVERVPSCNSGLVEDFKYGKCMLRSESSAAEFERFARQLVKENKMLFDAKLEFARNLAGPQSRKYFLSGPFIRDLKQRKFDAIATNAGLKKLVEQLAAIRAQSTFWPQSVTIGIVGDGGIGIGGNKESGIVLDLSGKGLSAEMYQTFGVSGGLITGGDASIAVTFWRARPRQTVGEARGLSASGGEGAIVGGAFWFAPRADSLGAIDFDIKQFLGFGVSVGAGASILPVDVRGTLALTQIMDWSTGKWKADVCGPVNKRPCHVVERVPSCNPGLKEDFIKHQCVK